MHVPKKYKTIQPYLCSLLALSADFYTTVWTLHFVFPFDVIKVLFQTVSVEDMRTLIDYVDLRLRFEILKADYTTILIVVYSQSAKSPRLHVFENFRLDCFTNIALLEILLDFAVSAVD